MEITGITQAAIQQVMLAELKAQLQTMYPGAQINSTSVSELTKMATSIATGAAKGVYDQVVGPIKKDIETITDAINALGGNL